MNTLTPTQQQKILTRTFSSIGHPVEDHADLMLMFYAGMVNELKNSPDFDNLEDSFENFMNSPDSDAPGQQLLDLYNLFESHNLEEDITEAFYAYLNRYINHLRPTLTEKQKKETQNILDDTAKLMQTDA